MKYEYFLLNISLEHKGATEDQVDEFFTKFIELAEQYNFTCGGGIKAVDENGEDITTNCIVK